MAAPSSVAVVGAGVIGAVVALHLAQRGAKVTLVERETPGGAATAGSFAWINAAATQGSEAYYRLRLQSLLEYQRLAAQAGIAVKQTGRLEWRADDGELARESAALAALGYPIRRVTGAQVRDLEPDLIDPPQSAVFAELEASVAPVQMTERLLTVARELGAELRTGCAVTGLTRDQDRVTGLATSDGPLAADCVVLAAGTASQALVEPLGVALPMANLPGLLFRTTPAPPLLRRVVLAPALHMKQDPDGRIVAGLDFGGGPVPNDPWAEGARLLAAVQARLRCPAPLALESVSTALRPIPRDGFPVIGFAGRPAGLYLTVMHSGITLAPLVGRLAAAEILDGIEAAPLAPFRPARFASGAQLGGVS